MNNIIKMLSANKDFRMVIADTHQISEKALSEFTGTYCIRKLLEQIITNCTLLSAINDFNAKISFSFRLSQGVSIFVKSQIQYLVLSIKINLITLMELYLIYLTINLLYQ